MMAFPKCVLIVDDHEGVRRALHSLFEAHGLVVCGEAVNGLDAIQQAQILHPDLILLDLSMPVMNGLEAARVLTELMPQVPLLMFTNNAGTLTNKTALNAGIRAVISKNDAYEELMRHARQLLH